VVFEVAEFSLFFLYEVQRTLNPVMRDFDIVYTSMNEFENRLDVGLSDCARERDVVEFLESKFDGFDVRCIAFIGSSGVVYAVTDDSFGSLPSWVCVLFVVGGVFCCFFFGFCVFASPKKNWCFIAA